MRVACLVTMVVLALCVCVQADDAAQMKRARAEAARRVGGLAINNDCVDTQNRTAKEYIAARLAPMADTQIGLVTHETIDMDNVMVYPSKVVETVNSHLIRAGHDPVAMALEFCHANGIPYLPSIRMNDIHDSMNTPGNWNRWSVWKREHLEYLMGQPGDYQKHPNWSIKAWWSAKNFEVAEVRDRQFRVLEEMCRNYDLDGLELDFLRSPIFFPPTFDMKPVEPKHSEIMNNFVRRVRKMTEHTARERGRPVLLAVRVPMSVQRSLAIGLDVQTWFEEDLADILVVGGGYVPMAMTQSVQAMVEFARPFDVPVYACISASGMQEKNGWDSVEAYRGAAMNIFHAGAGVYLFNFPYGLLPNGKAHQYSVRNTSPKQAQLYDELGSVATLKGRDKVYGIDYIIEPQFGGSTRPGLVVPDRLPLTLKPGGTVTAKLPVGEDIEANAPKGKTAHARLRLRLSRAGLTDDLTVRFNGQTLSRVPADPSASDVPVSTVTVAMYLNLPKQKRGGVATARSEFKITRQWKEYHAALALFDAAQLRGATDIQLRSILQIRKPYARIYVDDASLTVGTEPGGDNLLINPDFEQGHEAGETVPGWRGSGYDGLKHMDARFVISDAGRGGSRGAVLTRAPNQVWALADQHITVDTDNSQAIQFSVWLRADAPPRLDYDVDPLLVLAAYNDIELELTKRSGEDDVLLERLSLAVNYR